MQIARQNLLDLINHNKISLIFIFFINLQQLLLMYHLIQINLFILNLFFL